MNDREDLDDVTGQPFFWRCPRCDGFGKDPYDRDASCVRCGGDGTARVRIGDPGDGEGK